MPAHHGDMEQSEFCSHRACELAFHLHALARWLRSEAEPCCPRQRHMESCKPQAAPLMVGSARMAEDSWAPRLGQLLRHRWGVVLGAGSFPASSRDCSPVSKGQELVSLDAPKFLQPASSAPSHCASIQQRRCVVCIVSHGGHDCELVQ